MSGTPQLTLSLLLRLRFSPLSETVGRTDRSFTDSVFPLDPLTCELIPGDVTDGTGRMPFLGVVLVPFLLFPYGRKGGIDHPG